MPRHSRDHWLRLWCLLRRRRLLWIVYVMSIAKRDVIRFVSHRAISLLAESVTRVLISVAKRDTIFVLTQCAKSLLV